MAKEKYYAVIKGRIPGVYRTWGQTEEQISGFSGAVFHSFATLAEAERYMENQEEDNLSKLKQEPSSINKEIESLIDGLREDEVIAFIDGSYKNDVDGKEKYGFGVVLISKDFKMNLFKAYVSDKKMGSMNVAGEIEGAKQAILWSLENKKNKLTIFYDYEGIEKWATHEWNAKKEITKDYQNFIDEKSRLINIEFVHVKAHSGIIYNEKADALSKRALLSHGYKAYNDGSVYFVGYGVSDWVNIINETENSYKSFDESVTLNHEVSKIKEHHDRIEIRGLMDRVIINCYRGNKSYVQGKQSVLFQKLISCAIEGLPTEGAVVEVLNDYHALTIKETEVERRLIELMPNFPLELQDSKHNNNILSAVFNTMLVGYMPDYTCLITPIFRAMEYYLHKILNDHLGNNTETIEGKNNFAFFSKDQTTLKYFYNSSHRNLSATQIGYLDGLYNYYVKIRHPYAHWSKKSVDTPVITEMSVARDHLLEGLDIINDYYIQFS